MDPYHRNRHDTVKEGRTSRELGGPGARLSEAGRRQQRGQRRLHVKDVKGLKLAKLALVAGQQLLGVAQQPLADRQELLDLDAKLAHGLGGRLELGCLRTRRLPAERGRAGVCALNFGRRGDRHGARSGRRRRQSGLGLRDQAVDLMPEVVQPSVELGQGLTEVRHVGLLCPRQATADRAQRKHRD